MQPARTLDKGDMHLATGVDAAVPITGIYDLVDSADALQQKVEDGGELTTDEVFEVSNAALGLLLNPPQASWQITAGYGFTDAIQADLRVGIGSVRLSGRFQLLDSASHGIDASVGLGLGGFVRKGGELDQLPIVEVEDVRRFDVDVPLLFGWSGDLGHLWFGPKLALSTMDTGISVDTGEDARASVTLSGTTTYAGFQLGGAIGWRWIWLAIEVTVAYAWVKGDAAVEGETASTDVSESGEIEDTGLVIAPSVGLISRF